MNYMPPAAAFGTFLLIAPPDPGTLQTFIEEVAPQVRERVATARANATSDATSGQR